MRVLGVDPSLRSTGFGVIEDRGGGYAPVAFGVIRPSPRLPFHLRLDEIRSELEKIMTDFAADEVAIENPFFARNARTALSLGQVRGAVLVAVACRGCGLFEYSALEIKKAVTGYGQADKSQVQTMVRNLLQLADDALPDDATDALAAAICHLNARLYERRLGEA